MPGLSAAVTARRATQQAASGMFGDPRRGEALKRGDVLSQLGSDGVLEFAAHQRNLDLHRRGEPQLGAVAHGCQPCFRAAGSQSRGTRYADLPAYSAVTDRSPRLVARNLQVTRNKFGN